MEGSHNNGFLPITREVLAKCESEPKALLNSNYLPIGSVQLGQNQKIELPELKKTVDVEITALQESFQKQKRQPLPGNYEGALKYQPESIGISPALQIMDPQQLQVEKHQDFPSFKGHLELSGQEKWSKSCPVAGSSNAHTESQELNLEQQSEHHRTAVEDLHTSVNMEHVELEQQSDVPGLKMSLEKNLSILEDDLTIDTNQVEPKRPPGFKLAVEQLSHEQLQCVVPCGDAKKLDSVVGTLVKDQKLELSIEERPIEVQMTTAEEQIQTKQHTQGKELHPQDQRASKSESVNAGVTYDRQIRNTEMLQDLKQIFVVDESSRLMNQNKKGDCSKLRKIEVELPRRQQRPRGSKASESNQAHSTNANDHDLTLSSIKLDRQQKLDHPINRRPQKQKPTEVEKLSQSVEQEVKHCGNQKYLISLLAPITSGDVQMIENPRQDEPTTAGDFIQTQQQLQQQQQPQNWQLQPQVQCSSQVEQAMDKTMEESLPLQNQNEQNSLLTYQHQGRPIKLKPDVDAAGEILPVDGEDSHEELLSQIEGQRPKANPSTELTVRKLSSDHQTHNEQQPTKRGPGRPPRLTSAALQTFTVTWPPQYQHKQKRQKLNHQQKQKWPNGTGQGRVTRSRAASNAETISQLPPHDETAAAYTTCQEEKPQKHNSDGNNQREGFQNLNEGF
ncbi:unnamed protein product [Dovyalis caffra]|uniref:Uncharacterized protein n=1 Tax=Dovyalis caffra TaxID=77055 RepID=A0AAV1RE55_9ROSI|nr:unnamed protein product [Dovyalis caffra]